MSTQIHPTAVVDSAVDLGVEVRIGPYAIIEAGCVIGDYCEIHAHAVICKGTLMGPHNHVGYGAVLGAEPQDIGFKGGRTWVEIGSGNRLREYVTIHRASVEGTATCVGNDNYLMGGVHLGHDVEVGNRTILANNTLARRPCDGGGRRVPRRGDAGAPERANWEAGDHARGDADRQGRAAVFHGDGCEHGERDQPDRVAAGGAVARDAAGDPGGVRVDLPGRT